MKTILPLLLVALLFAGCETRSISNSGCSYIVCCWGVLESARLDKGGKAALWVPVVGYFVTDQK